MAGPIRISFVADAGRAQREIRDIGAETEEVGDSVESSGRGMSKGLDAVGNAASNANSAVDLATNALSSLDQIQHIGRNEARRLARAQLDVDQAMADQRQAAIDLKQATEDLKQAQIDGKQAAVDVKQAQIDIKQADLDVAEAQKAYTDAVKAHGAKSTEAKQAEIDLAQAKADQQQATVDLSQAQADQRQSQIDATQAIEDGKQSQIDARESALGLAEAQNAINPTGIQQVMHTIEMFAPVLAAATIAADVLSGSMVAQKAIMIASAAASGVMTAAQWALNVAMSANPIGLVILAIAALIGIVVIAWKKSDTFRRIATAAFNAVWGKIREGWNWLRSNWPKLLAILTGPIGIATALITRNWNRITGGVRAVIGWVRGNWPRLLAILTGPIGVAVGLIIRNWNRIIATARSIPGRIAAVFSNIGSLLINAGVRLITGFIGGINRKFNDVRSTLSRLTKLLPVWKGPATRDRKILSGAGADVISGFQRGLESQYGNVRGSLDDFTRSLGGSVGTSGTVAIETGVAPAWARKLIDLLDGGLTITLESSGNRGDDALIQLIRERVTVKGGTGRVLGIVK